MTMEALDESLISWDIEALHLDEAEFLFTSRELLLDAADHELAELELGPERRLLAHLDALVIGGPVVTERLLLPTIEDSEQDAMMIAAATLALFDAAPHEQCSRALALLDVGEATQREGLVRALQRSRRADLDGWLLQGLSGATGLGVAARLEVLAGRQVSVGAGLLEYLNATPDQLEVARAAAVLARHCHERELLGACGALAQAPDAELRRRAVETALCRQLGGAWEAAAYWAFVPGESPFRRDALTWVALLGNASAHARLLAQLDDPTRRAEVLWALGFTGRVAVVDACMELLADDQLGPLAGEVVRAIAGLSLDDERCWRDAPDDAPDAALPAFDDDNLDAELGPSSDATLAVPEPGAIVAWWQQRRAGFDPVWRYIGGRPLSHATLLAALEHAPLRRRHALALGLAMRSGGAQFIDTRALCRTQREQLARAAQLGPIDWQGGLELR